MLPTTVTPRRRVRFEILNTLFLLVMVLGLQPLGVHLHAQPGSTKEVAGATRASEPFAPVQEIENALVRLPLAAILGTALALRPKRRGQAKRTVTVVQTQIMLAVVGSVIMIIVSDSLSRAFGIVGIIGLVRFRTNTDDPKDGVVMLCTLCAGLACGAGLYMLAPFATFFMAAMLWTVEYFEPDALKYFELIIITKQASEFRHKVESVLHGLKLDYELLSQSDEQVSYSVSTPLEVRTRDISDTFHILTTNDVEVEWKERRGRK